MRPKPLSGLRILDLTRLLPGPMATLHLADLGADVIKIEDTGAGDYARTMGHMRGDSSIFFQLLNRNKRSLRLDLKQAQGVEIFLRLARDADIIVEGFRPGVVDKLGIGYATVAALNPRIVYCAISGYGQDGPYRERAGHDINYIGYAGVLDQIGVEGGAPAVPNFQIGDLLGGALTPLVGMLAAVIDAKASGKGRYVDVAMTDAVFAHNIFPLTNVLGGGAEPRGAGLISGGSPCYGVYATADGRHMAVGALEPKFWQTLCTAIERPDLIPLGLARGKEGARVKAELAAIFASQPQSHWTQKFDKLDCCVTPVLRMEESLSDAQLTARGMVVEAEGLRQFTPPYKLSEYEFTVDHAAPASGAHTEEILQAAGYSAEQIAAFKNSAVI